jgi:hypothetical protein
MEHHCYTVHILVLPPCRTATTPAPAPPTPSTLAHWQAGHCGGFEVGYVQEKSYMMCHDVSLDLQTKVETVPAARDAHKSTGFRFTFLLPVCRFNARAAMTFRTRGWPD